MLERDSFDRLYRAHAGAIRRLVSLKGCRQEAEDLTQDVFTRAWESLPTFQHRAGFQTWVTRIALNAVTDLYRTRATRRRFLERMAADPTQRPPRETPTATSVEMRAALRRLPRCHQRILVMFHVHGYRHRDLAQALGVPVGTTKSQLHRAHRLLRHAWISQR